MSPDLKKSRFELEIECCIGATQDGEVFVESEAALLETAPRTEELRQT